MRYSSLEDPRYLRLLESSRKWKERNKHKAWYKKRKKQQDRRWYLESRNTEKFKEQRRERNRRWRSKEKVKEVEARRVQKFLKKHPERVNAYSKVQYALRTGRIKRPDKCTKCGWKPKPRLDGLSSMHAHHADYSKPLKIVWLCSFCHAALRRKY